MDFGTLPNAEPIRDVAAWAPEDRILVETDAPFLAPVPFRGKPNEPAYVTYVAAQVAQLRGLRVGRSGHWILERRAERPWNKPQLGGRGNRIGD